MSGGAATPALLVEFYNEKLSAITEHQAHARLVASYDANNAYQYVINREETQLTWLANAIAASGQAVPSSQA